MDKIISYVETYGLAILVIALATIFLIGLLKVCKAYNWIKSAKIKKLVYYISDVIFAFGGSAIYFAIFKISFSEYLVYAGAELSITTFLYAVYENFGIRELVKILINVIAKAIKGNPNSKINKELKKLGLNEDSVNRVNILLNAEKSHVESQTKTSDDTTIQI